VFGIDQWLVFAVSHFLLRRPAPEEREHDIVSIPRDIAM
jgi:hypothetical protein